MTQFLDKTGLSHYTTKMKEYIKNNAGGISKDEADATYAAKSVLASSSTNGLMSMADKDALDSIVTSSTVGEYVIYMVDDNALNPEVFSIVKFSGFVSVAESDIDPSGSISTTKTVFNNTTNTFIAATTSELSTTSYFSVVDRTYGTQTSTQKGSTPFTNHLYIDSLTNDMYMYNGTTLSKVSPYIISSSEIDTLFS